MAALLLSATLAMSASAAAPVTLQSGFVLLEPETPPLEATMDTPSCRAGTDCGGTGLWVAWEDSPPNSSYTNPWTGPIPFPKSKVRISRPI